MAVDTAVGLRVGGERALRGGDLVWRVGNVANPLDFTPPTFCKWEHRFDDPAREFRTLYCAPDPLTCLRETLADFRPLPKLLGFLRSLGDSRPFRLPASWREKHVLASGSLHLLTGHLVDLDDVEIRRELGVELADLLMSRHLDMGEIQGSDRRLTQAIAGKLYRRGAAGAVYRSKVDNKPCIALFEERAELVSAGEVRSLAESLDELERVCREFGLDLR